MTAAMLTIIISIAGKPTPFIVDKERGLVISKSCLKTGVGLSCRAYDVLNELSLEKLGQIADGADPGAAACLQLHGEPIIGHNEAGREYGLCRFKDHSLVSAGTLHFFAMDNDRNSRARKKPPNN